MSADEVNGAYWNDRYWIKLEHAFGWRWQVWKGQEIVAVSFLQRRSESSARETAERALRRHRASPPREIKYVP